MNKITMEHITFGPNQEIYQPTIYISALCGYFYTKENYEIASKKLLSYGFERFRTQEEDYSEMWKLAGFWQAAGKLKEFIEPIKNDRKLLDLVVSWLSREVSFGTLDVSYQRLAMTPD